MKREWIAVFLAIAAAGGVCGAAGSKENLCYNGTFDVAEKPLDGWTIDYDWTGSTHYQGNHTRVSPVASHKGKRQVMMINGAKETKAESRPIVFEQGARYRCTLEIQGSMPHIHYSKAHVMTGTIAYLNRRCDIRMLILK